MAQVVAFADPRNTAYSEPEIVQERVAVGPERVAANYVVPIIPLEELREHALIYGEEYIEHG
jgi:hypothetical protein